MDFVQGRIFKDVTFAELDANNNNNNNSAGLQTSVASLEKGAVYSAMSAVLAAIHKLDYGVEELKDYGKTDGGYVKRNLARWASQVSWGRECERAGE